LIQDKKDKLSVDSWKKVFDIFGVCYNTKFYLVLGVEPLLLGDSLVDIIKFWNKNKIFYGLYSTSPQPYFDRYKYKLLEVGLNNWSCGIDGLPGYGNPGHVDVKISSGLKGLIWMADEGVQTMSVVTLSNRNLEYADKIIEYCQENIKNGMSCLNPIEWQHNETFDFFSKKKLIWDLVIPEGRRNKVREIAEKIKILSKRPGYQIQNSDRNLDIYHLIYDRLNYRCNGLVGMGVDCDGSLRRCGYNRGREISKYKVWDIPKDPEKIYEIWYRDALSCEGCFWSWVQGLEETYNVVVANSEFYQDRWVADEKL
jgi:hypothetical protein